MCDKIKSTSDTCYLRYHLKQQETMHVRLYAGTVFFITNHPSTAKGHQGHDKVIMNALSVKSSSFSMLQSFINNKLRY